ncbi:hypothetical protein K523DRAFT_82055 [Schizophyllum commune Tattone D]|nr:hypothetical protein K523DRAFT_82055 [Schizophyllum commune Tattone D]
MRFNCMRLALPSAKRARKKRTRNRISSEFSRRQQLPQNRTWPQADAEDSSITIDGSSHQTSPIPLPHAICVCLISFFLPPGLGGRAVSVAFFLREFASVGGGESWSGGRAACGRGAVGAGGFAIFRKGSEARPSRGGSTLS